MDSPTPSAPPRTDSMDDAAISVADWQSRYASIVHQRRTIRVKNQEGFTGQVDTETREWVEGVYMVNGSKVSEFPSKYSFRIASAVRLTSTGVTRWVCVRISAPRLGCVTLSNMLAAFLTALLLTSSLAYDHHECYRFFAFFMGASFVVMYQPGLVYFALLEFALVVAHASWKHDQFVEFAVLDVLLAPFSPA